MRKQSSPRQQKPQPPAMDPWVAARTAGLRYVSDTQPGIRRQRVGNGFRYLGVDGTRMRNPEVLHRIKALAIPPAWTEVWICPQPDGHLQATGRDARGRKQYRYHPDWRAVRDATKYDRMVAFGEALPHLRMRLEHDLARSGLPREKVLATVVRLLETTLIRIGNLEYARANRSFGLTTMRDRHVQVAGDRIRFQFRGKSGKQHSVHLHDRRLARIVKRCQDLPGYELFQYVDAAGEGQTIDSADVNAYLRDLTGQDFTAKDVRTWAGTVMAMCALREFDAFDSETEARKNIVDAMGTVAGRLGNTRAVCRKSYVHPEVLNAYLDRSLFAMPVQEAAEPSDPGTGLYPEEAVALAFLKQRAAQQDSLAQKAG